MLQIDKSLEDQIRNAKLRADEFCRSLQSSRNLVKWDDEIPNGNQSSTGVNIPQNNRKEINEMIQAIQCRDNKIASIQADNDGKSKLNEELKSRLKILEHNYIALQSDMTAMDVKLRNALSENSTLKVELQIYKSESSRRFDDKHISLKVQNESPQNSIVSMVTTPMTTPLSSSAAAAVFSTTPHSASIPLSQPDKIYQNGVTDSHMLHRHSYDRSSNAINTDNDSDNDHDIDSVLHSSHDSKLISVIAPPSSSPYSHPSMNDDTPHQRSNGNIPTLPMSLKVNANNDSSITDTHRSSYALDVWESERDRRKEYQNLPFSDELTSQPEGQRQGQGHRHYVEDNNRQDINAAIPFLPINTSSNRFTSSSEDLDMSSRHISNWDKEFSTTDKTWSSNKASSFNRRDNDTNGLRHSSQSTDDQRGSGGGRGGNDQLLQSAAMNSDRLRELIYEMKSLQIQRTRTDDVFPIPQQRYIRPSSLSSSSSSVYMAERGLEEDDNNGDNADGSVDDRSETSSPFRRTSSGRMRSPFHVHDDNSNRDTMKTMRRVVKKKKIPNTTANATATAVTSTTPTSASDKPSIKVNITKTEKRDSSVIGNKKSIKQSTPTVLRGREPSQPKPGSTSSFVKVKLDEHKPHKSERSKRTEDDIAVVVRPTSRYTRDVAREGKSDREGGGGLRRRGRGTAENDSPQVSKRRSSSTPASSRKTQDIPYKESINEINRPTSATRKSGKMVSYQSQQNVRSTHQENNKSKWI